MDPHMNVTEFRKCATELINIATNYLENVRERSVLPDVKPGYMRDLIPNSMPEKSEDWEDVLKDIEKVVMPGMTHWNHPNFHAYFPAGNSYPAMCADLLDSALVSIGFIWITSPVATELEMVMLDWLAKSLHLPRHFLYESNAAGGGVIQTNASEATLIAVLAARSRKMKQVMGAKLENLVIYASEQSHCSVKRAALLGAVQIRLLPTDEKLSLRGDTLEKAIKEDKENGFIPCIVVGTLGTTNTCAFDNIKEIGLLCEEYDMWFHIDAAYAGSAFICPEFRPLLDGVEFADSYNFNPHKWLLVNFDCSAMWVKDRYEIANAFTVNPAYLKYDMEGQLLDFRHIQIPFGRRLRALKLWFVFRMFGVEGLKQFIRKHIELAKEFEALVTSDKKWTVEYPVNLGLVCFRHKGTDKENEILVKMINERKNIYISSVTVNGRCMLRFIVSSRFTTSEDIEFAWAEIQTVASLMKLK